MSRTSTILGLCVALTSCSNILGIGDLSGPVAPIDSSRVDGAIDVIVADQIKITGTATTNDVGLPPASQLSVQFVRLPDRAGLASGMTDAGGKYTLSVPTSGAPLDGYVVLSASAMGNLPESAHYPPAPFTSDQPFDLFELSNPNLDSFAQQVGEPRQPNTAFVMVLVLGLDGKPRANTQVSTSPPIDSQSRVFYADVNLQPVLGLTATTPAGIAYIFNAPISQLQVLLTVNGVQSSTSRFADITIPRTAHYLAVQAASGP